MYRCHSRGYAMFWTPVQTLGSKNRAEGQEGSVSRQRYAVHCSHHLWFEGASIVCTCRLISDQDLCCPTFHSTRWPWENCSGFFLYPWLTLETQNCSGEKMCFIQHGWMCCISHVLHFVSKFCVWYPSSFPFVMLIVVPVALLVCISVLVWGSSSKLYWPTW